jgi:hypothetical protein
VAGLRYSHVDARLSHGKSMNEAWQVPILPIGSISLIGCTLRKYILSCSTSVSS